MSKKIKTIIIGAILLASLTSYKSYASTNLTDELYKAAYEATVKASQNKDQASINKARQAVSHLPKEFKSAIGEFSKKIDEVQQELFIKFMGILFDSNGNKKDCALVTQEEINNARELVNSFDTCEGNKAYINSWSSAIDEFQRYQIYVADILVRYAESVNIQQNKASAMESVNRLLKVKNNDTVLDYAKALEKRVNAIIVTNENKPISSIDPNTGNRPELSTEDGKDHYTDPTSYRQHVRFFGIDEQAYFEDIYNNAEGRWDRYRVGFSELQDFEPEPSIATISYFSGNNETDFRKWGPCVASFIKVTELKDSSKSYAELIRLADGFVLERINPKGKIQVFSAPQVSMKALNDFNTMNYSDLMNKWRN